MNRKQSHRFAAFRPLCLGLAIATISIAGANFTTPGRPGRPEVTNIKRDQCDIQYTKPESDGGARITGYYIEKRDVRDGVWVRCNITTRRECTIYNLIEGSEMEFRVFAANKAGLGEPSYPSNPVIIRDPQSPR